jgi:hypothetical protein
MRTTPGWGTGEQGRALETVRRWIRFAAYESDTQDVYVGCSRTEAEFRDVLQSVG